MKSMKWFFVPIICLFFSFSSKLPTKCGDGIVYALESQTADDERFTEFQKITGKKNSIKFPGGDKTLDKLLREKLVLSEEAQQHVFNLNYYFVVNCDGSVGEVTVLGDSEVAKWTNIENMIKHTLGWQPAMVNGKSVDCIYFRKLLIQGSNYALKK